MRKFQPLFVNGPARSGSTLLCPMLSAHSEIMVAADTFFPLFRSLRNAIVRQRAEPELQRSFEPSSPIQDYYFTDERIRVMDTIQTADLNVPFDEKEWDDLLESTRGRAQYETPDLMPHLHKMRGPTYQDLFDNGLQVIAAARRAEERRFVGFKDVWTVEFFAPLARAYPDARFVIILRDPRAIIVSMLKMSERDASQGAHTLSYARHCRKYFAFVSRYLNEPLFADRLHVIIYERLVTEPEKEVRRLCDFLQVDYQPGMLDPQNYLDYSTGSTWKGNSSFEQALSGISVEQVERWRKKIDPDVLAMTDFICTPEMRLAGYEPAQETTPYGWPDLKILDYIIQNNEKGGSWRSDLQDPQKDYGFELFRHALLKLPSLPSDVGLIRRSFLFEEVYERLRDNTVEVIV